MRRMAMHVVKGFVADGTDGYVANAECRVVVAACLYARPSQVNLGLLEVGAVALVAVDCGRRSTEETSGQRPESSRR